ncbi:hypothetical protein BDQ94DRAFT_155672, partial [Aspergillus welwitschiae]
MSTGDMEQGSTLEALVQETTGDSASAQDNGAPLLVARTMHGVEPAAQLKPIADGPQETPNLASAESEGFSGIEPVGREADLQKPASHTEPFIQCLSDVLDDLESKDVMCWSQDGHSFSILAENDLPAELLDRFGTECLQSLVRRLYYYGFHKVGGTWRHDLFARGVSSSICPGRRSSNSPLTDIRHGLGPRYKIIQRRRGR